MRGVKIAAFILAFSVAVGMLGGMGWFGWVGVHPDPGTEEAEEEVQEIEDIDAEDTGGDEFSMARAAVDVIDTIRDLTVRAGSALANLGVPHHMAFGIQVIVGFALALTVAQFIRGVVIE